MWLVTLPGAALLKLPLELQLPSGPTPSHFGFSLAVPKISHSARMFRSHLLVLYLQAMPCKSLLGLGFVNAERSARVNPIFTYS